MKDAHLFTGFHTLCHENTPRPQPRKRKEPNYRTMYHGGERPAVSYRDLHNPGSPSWCLLLIP